MVYEDYNICKPNGDYDPLSECTTLTDYIDSLIRNVLKCRIHIDKGEVSDLKKCLSEISEILLEMSDGNWKINDLSPYED